MTDSPTCELCRDVGTVLWDPIDMGPPPPPPDYDETEHRLWHWTWAAEVRPCPSCQGWGCAYNGPWARAYRIATGKEYLYPDRPSGWEPARDYVVSWYANEARKEYEAVLKLKVNTQRAWAAMELVQKRIRALAEPPWPERSITSCDQCSGACSIAPTYHPLTGRAAVACCECGYAWHYEESAEEKAKREAYSVEAREKAEREMRVAGVSEAAAKALLERHLPYEVLTAFCSHPLTNTDPIPEVVL